MVQRPLRSTPSNVVIAIVATLTATASLFDLSACSPKRYPVAAVRMADGRAEVLMTSCKAFEPDQVSVFTEGADIPGRWAIRRPDTATAPNAVWVLEAPPGWTITEQTLRALQPGVTYGVSVRRVNVLSQPVDFSVERLRELKAGQVLASTSGGQTKAVSESQYRADADEVCH